MNTYLAIITTILVLTQIIRVTQNAMQLSHRKRLDADNNEILAMWETIKSDIRQIKHNTDREVIG